MIINKAILYVLSVICHLFFVLFLIFYLLGFSLSFFSDNGEIEYAGGNILFYNFIKGPYDVPVTFELNFQDSLSADIIANRMYKDESYSYMDNDTKENYRISKLNQFRKKQYFLLNDTIVNQKIVKQPFPFQSMKKMDAISEQVKDGRLFFGDKSIPAHYIEEDFLSVKENDIKGEAFVSMKSNRLWYNFLLSLRSHIFFIVGIYMLWQIMTITKMLNDQMNFSADLFKRIRNLGWAFAIYQLLIFILSWIYSTWYSSVGIETKSTIVGFEPYMNISLQPMLEYHLSYIVIGGLVILFSYLSRVGSDLKEEVDLTV